MASLTQIYVSSDGLNFNLLELDKNEPIVMKLTNKDTDDLSKVFSPYSQSFNIPATPNNRLYLEFFGDTDVQKSVQDRLYYCKMYSDDLLYMTGKLKVTDANYTNNIIRDFTVNFTTSMTDLKTRLGDDNINELNDDILIDYKPSNVENYLRAIYTASIVKYFVPLISNRRVWSYDPSTASVVLDNVAYKASVDPSGNNLVQSTELRPALDLASIVNLIRTKYSLDITIPLETKEEYNTAYVWCNNEVNTSQGYKKLILKNNIGNVDNNGFLTNPKKYVVTSSTVDSSFKVVRNPAASIYYQKYILLQIIITGVLLTSDESSDMSIRLIRKSDGLEIITDSFQQNDDGNYFAEIKISEGYFVANQIEFFVEAKFGSPLVWSNCSFVFRDYFYQDALPPGNYTYKSTVNNNSTDYGAKLNLIRSLPETKVIDFISTLFKTFNISVYDTSPDNENLYWLTPLDIETNGLVYSKATPDYTEYVDETTVKKSIPNDYNYYNFKLQESKYRSNEDYKIGAGQEYGQLTYPAIKPAKASEYKIEAGFSIMPPITLVDEVVTYYGFTSDKPELLDTGESRYEPNFDELTFFYSHGSASLNATPIGYQSLNSAGNFVNTPLFNYIKVMPWTKISKQSLSFSILVFNNIQYIKNLYSQYYSKQTERYLDPNTLKQEFDLILPSSELYLNEATTIQGGGATPVGFRLQNDIIISETKFSILDTQIDRTTGKTKLTLLNY